jgi:thioesterase domain-containing protein
VASPAGIDRLGAMDIVPPGESSPPRWVSAGPEDGVVLVALQTWHDEVQRFERLAAAMPGHRIVSILPPVPGVDSMPRRIDAWLDHHEAVLEGLGIEPPYRLIGWSFGGVVALELARRLRDRDVEVIFVGLLDTIRPRLRPLSTREYFWFHLGESLQLEGDRERVRYLWRRTRFLVRRSFPGAWDRVRRLLIRLRLREDRPPAPVKRATQPLQASIFAAYLNYRAAAVPFAVSLFATVESATKMDDPVLRWAGYFHGGYELVCVPGAHTTLFDGDHVAAVGSAIQRSIARGDMASQPLDRRADT